MTSRAFPASDLGRGFNPFVKARVCRKQGNLKSANRRHSSGKSARIQLGFLSPLQRKSISGLFLFSREGNSGGVLLFYGMPEFEVGNLMGHRQRDGIEVVANGSDKFKGKNNSPRTAECVDVVGSQQNDHRLESCDGLECLLGSQDIPSLVSGDAVPSTLGLVQSQNLLTKNGFPLWIFGSRKLPKVSGRGAPSQEQNNQVSHISILVNRQSPTISPYPTHLHLLLPPTGCVGSRPSVVFRAEGHLLSY